MRLGHAFTMFGILLECSETSLRYKKSHSSFDLIGPDSFFTWLITRALFDNKDLKMTDTSSTKNAGIDNKTGTIVIVPPDVQVYVVMISRWTNLDCLTMRKPEVGNRVPICGMKFIIYKTPLNLKWTVKGELMNMRVEWNRSTVIWYIYIFIFGILDRLCTRKFYGWGVWGRF